MKKQAICMLAALAMVIGLFTACGGAGSDMQISEAVSESVLSEASEPAAAAAGMPSEEEPAAAAGSLDETSAEEAEAEEAGPLGFVETAVDLPLVDETVTFTVFNKTHPGLSETAPGRSENLVQLELEKRTGIHLDITETSTYSYNDNFMLMLAGGDWTDIFTTVGTTYPGGLAAALNEDVIINLADYEEYMPNYSAFIHSDENLFRDVSLGGGALGTFYNCWSSPLGLDAGLLLRADWIDALGMEMPETVDEYYDFITACHNEYGAVLHLPKNGCMTNQAFMSAFNVAGYFLDIGFFSTMMCYTVEDDKVICGFMEEGFKQYLQLMNKWYSEDLISHDYMSVAALSNVYVGEDSDSVSDLLNNKISVWGDNPTNAVTYSSENAVDPNFRVAPTVFPTLEKGDTIHSGPYTGTAANGAYSISTTCENPELAVQWIDYSYTSEGSELFNWGIEGETYTVDPDGTHHYTDLIMNNPDYTQGQATFVYLGSDESYIVDLAAYHSVHNELQMECFDVWNCNRTCENAVSSFMGMTNEEGARFSELSGDIISYLYESVAKFITGEQNFDADYDKFLTDMDALGVSEMTAIEQDVYDRWAGIAE